MSALTTKGYGRGRRGQREIPFDLTGFSLAPFIHKPPPAFCRCPAAMQAQVSHLANGLLVVNVVANPVNPVRRCTEATTPSKPQSRPRRVYTSIERKCLLGLLLQVYEQFLLIGGPHLERFGPCARGAGGGKPPLMSSECQRSEPRQNARLASRNVEDMRKLEAPGMSPE